MGKIITAFSVIHRMTNNYKCQTCMSLLCSFSEAVLLGLPLYIYCIALFPKIFHCASETQSNVAVKVYVVQK